MYIASRQQPEHEIVKFISTDSLTLA